MSKKYLQAIFTTMLLFSFTQIASAQYCTVPTATGFALVAGNCANPTKQEREANPLYYTSFSSPVKYTILSIGYYGDEIYQCPAGKVLNPSPSNMAMVKAYCGAGQRTSTPSMVVSNGKATVSAVGFTYTCQSAQCSVLTPANVMPDERAAQYASMYTVSTDNSATSPLCTLTPPARCNPGSPDRTGEVITAVINGVTYVTGQGYTYTCSSGTCSAPVSGSGGTTASSQSNYVTGGTTGSILLTDEDLSSSFSSCVELTSTSLRYQAKDANTNGEVTTLQIFLNDTNYLPTSPTGFFGSGTLKAVKAFQKANNLNPTGFVGLNTRAVIKSVSCSSTSSGNATLSDNYLSPLTSTLPAGCASSTGFSRTTGLSCAGSFPVGCDSASGYSVTTGAKCSQ